MSEPQAGHNSNEQLKSILARINTLEDQKRDTGKDIAEIYLEAKGNGFNPKALRVIVRRQRADANKMAELEAEVDAYMASLGMI